MSTFHVFRVSEGIGNACAFKFPDGSLGIIDWGTQEDEPIKELNLHDALRIRFILATHAHADHVLGIPKLMKACIASGTSIGRLVFPSGYMKGLGKDYLREARTIAKDNGIEQFGVSISPLATLAGPAAPLIIDQDVKQGWRILALAPPAELVSVDELRAHVGKRTTGNVTSIVSLYQTLASDKGIGDVLVPGDATPTTLEFARDFAAKDGRVSLDCDLLVVPHHGSRHNFPTWLPSIIHGNIVVSAAHNSEHHPSEEVLRNSVSIAEAASSKVFCTSYAQCCSSTFASTAGYRDGAICFGHLRFSVGTEGSKFTGSSHDGDTRRLHGLCRRGLITELVKA